MSKLPVSIFDFESRQVRVVIIDGEPWFVGKDVAEALGYANPQEAVRDHCKGVAKRSPLQTDGGMQNHRIINEPDMLRLVVSSQLPSAVEFERKVFEEILPTIRKTGRYESRPETPKSLLVPPQVFTHFFRIGKLLGLDRNAAALSANVATRKQTGADVLALMGQTHLDSESQEHWFTPTELGERHGMSARKFNLLLADAGLQTKIDGKWEPLEPARGMARLYDTGKRHSDGAPVTQVKWSSRVTEQLNFDSV